jgi:hypothetical protein
MAEVKNALSTHEHFVSYCMIVSVRFHTTTMKKFRVESTLDFSKKKRNSRKEEEMQKREGEKGTSLIRAEYVT